MIATVALMLKAPRHGQVKTRLAHTIGTDDATRIYRRLVEHQITQIPREWSTHIHFAPLDAEDEMRSWLGTAHSYSPQPDGDLGDRLAFAMHLHFARDLTPLIFLGGDCPYLTTSHFTEVMRHLIKTDAVLIPALDGGYCLFALRQSVDRVFSAITWNSDAVADETRERLREERITWEELPGLEDVDDEASWARAKLAIPDLDR